METSDTSACIGFGIIISFVVSFLRKVPIVNSHPKVVATFLSAAVTGVRVWAGAAPAETWSLLICVLTQLFAAIGTFETVTKPAAKIVRGGG